MNNETLLSNLLCKVQDFVSEQNYCKGTWYLYHAAMNHMRHYYEDHGTQHYSPDLSWECVLERRHQYDSGQIAYDTFLYVWKISEMLEECHLKGKITYKHSSNWNADRSAVPFSEIAESYRQHRLSKGYSPNTVRGEMSEVKNFLSYAAENGYASLSQVRRHDITSYLAETSKTRRSGMSHCLTRLRAFFRFLAEAGELHESMISTLQMKVAFHKKIHMGFSVEETDRIMEAYTKSGQDIGKNTVDAIKEGFEDNTSHVQEALGNIANSLPAVIDKSMNKGGDTGEALDQLGQNAIKCLEQGITSQTPEALESAGAVAFGITEELVKLNEYDWASIGTNLTDSLASSITDGQSKVVGAITRLCIAAVDAAKDELEIASPSKKFSRFLFRGK